MLEYFSKGGDFMKYQHCIDCGKPKDYNMFRNCKNCMAKVKQGIWFSECQRCHKQKKEDIHGLCPKCSAEIELLNSKASR